MGYVPQGWLPCDGRSLPSSSNQALFSLLGYNFGGSGANFNLPDLRGTAVVGAGSTAGNGVPAVVGQRAGAETVTLTLAEMPTHNHQLNGVNANGPGAPVNGLFAQPVVPATIPAPAPAAPPPVYGVTPTVPNQITALNAFAIVNAGGNQPHENRQPFLTATYGICVSGIYPMRD
ncbi:MAG: hypothetical protein RLY86_651 [Pseudomonadota bacterium]